MRAREDFVMVRAPRGAPQSTVPSVPANQPVCCECDVWGLVFLFRRNVNLRKPLGPRSMEVVHRLCMQPHHLLNVHVERCFRIIGFFSLHHWKCWDLRHLRSEITLLY